MLLDTLLLPPPPPPQPPPPLSLPAQERECEHLRQIIKELSQSRAKVQKTKVQLEEQFVALQQEYYRCVLSP